MSSAVAIDADVAALLARLGTEVRRITSDSRDVREGDAFAAYPGTRHDGREFISDAIAHGAGAVLWETRGFHWNHTWKLPHLPLEDLKAKLGLASAADSPLQVSNPPHVERLQLASGNELLTVSGRVINPTGREQVVPPLNARLTSQTGKLIYSWTIAPPTRSLAAGASASFNSAEVNVPSGGEYLTITLGQKA